ncbi:MAG: hypothetical protein ACP5GH_03960 [Nitrososphaeria archaeon]
MKRITLEEAIAREISVLAYTAMRQTGFKPLSIRRSFRTIRFQKILIAGIFLFVFIVLGVAGHLRPASSTYQKPFMGPAFIVAYLFSLSGLAISMLLLPLSYAVYATTSLRDFLATLPLDENEVQRKVLLSIIKLVDYPLISVLMGALADSMILRSPFYVLAALTGVSLAFFLAFLSIDLVYWSRGRSPTVSTLVRILGGLPMLFFLLFLYAGNALSFLSQSQIDELFFAPPFSIISLYTPLGLAFTVLWMILPAAWVLRKAPQIAWRLIGEYPVAFFPQPRAPRAISVRWRIYRSKTLALMMADLRGAKRSLVASFVTVLIIVASTLVSGGYSVSPSNAPALIDVEGLELAFLSIMIPLAFYYAETRGAWVLRIMPISRTAIAIPKLLLTVLSYYIFMSAIAILALLKHVSFVVLLPFIFGVLGPLSSVPLIGIIFEEIYKSGGALSMLFTAAGYLASGIVVGLPFAVYFILEYFKMPVLTSLVAMVLSGALEFSSLMLVLHLYD